MSAEWNRAALRRGALAVKSLRPCCWRISLRRTITRCSLLAWTERLLAAWLAAGTTATARMTRRLRRIFRIPLRSIPRSPGPIRGTPSLASPFPRSPMGPPELLRCRDDRYEAVRGHRTRQLPGHLRCRRAVGDAAARGGRRARAPAGARGQPHRHRGELRRRRAAARALDARSSRRVLPRDEDRAALVRGGARADPPFARAAGGRPRRPHPAPLSRAPGRMGRGDGRGRR